MVVTTPVGTHPFGVAVNP
ncbi:hypothetical protein [Paenibacillus sp. Soil766]|nr:hypothetical protein [Paenibacillus sp. Soil766]